MSERAEALATRLEDVLAEVIVFVEGCTAERWHTVTRAEGWSVCAVCRHIARGFEVHPQVIQLAADGQPLPTGYTWAMVHESNAAQARAWAALPKADVLAALRRDGDGAIRAVRALRGDQLDRAVLSPLDQVPSTVQRMVEGMIEHPRAHLDSVHEILRRANAAAAR